MSDFVQKYACGNEDYDVLFRFSPNGLTGIRCCERGFHPPAHRHLEGSAVALLMAHSEPSEHLTS